MELMLVSWEFLDWFGLKIIGVMIIKDKQNHLGLDLLFLFIL